MELTGFRLVLIHAPAGSGKTTLMSQWYDAVSRNQRQDVFWYSVTEDERDPLGLADYLLAALGGEDARPAPTSSDRNEALQRVQAFLEARCQKRPVIVFIDDFHLCEDEDGNHTLGELMAARIPGLTFFVASRSRPRFPIGRNRASGELMEITPRDLHFNASETVDFFRTVGLDDLPQPLLSQLHERSEGWAAGLRLMALVMRRNGDTGAALGGANLQGGYRAFAEYFMEEVLDSLAPETRDFLLQTSILDSLSPDLCRVVTGREDAGLILDRLAEARLFVIALPGAQLWYRYHHLFQEFLRNRLFLRGEARCAALHRKAAEWFLAAGNPHDAVAHAFEARDVSWAAELIERYCLYDYLSYGRFDMYARWMQQLPRQARNARPLLRLLMVWRLINLRRFYQATQVLDEIEADHPYERAPPAVGDAGPALDVPGRLHLMRVLIGAYSGNLTMARTHIDVLKRVRLDDQAFGQLDLDSIHGYVALREGKYTRADALTRSALVRYTRISCYWGMIHSLCIAAMSARMRGALDDASKSLEHALDLAAAHFSERSYMASLPSALLGDIRFFQGDIATAEKLWRQALGRDGVPDFVGLGERSLVPVIGLSRLLDLTGRAEQATQLLDSASRRAYEAEDFGGELIFAIERADRAFRNGDASLGQRELDRADMQISEARQRYPASIHGVWHPYHRVHARALKACGKTPEALELLNKIEVEAAECGALLSQMRIKTVIAEISGGKPDRDCLDRAAEMGVDHAILASLAGPLSDPAGEPGQNRIAVDPFTDPEARLGQLQRNYGFTRREIEVLPLLASGLPNAQIADKLGISLNTVKTHTKNIYSKMNVSNRTQVAIMMP